MPKGNRLRLFFDADVLFAAAASPSEYGASLVLLRLSEITLIEGIASVQVATEAARNLERKVPQSVPTLEYLVRRALRIVPDPARERVHACAGRADWKDLPILVAAADAQCPILTTFNTRHFRPGLPGMEVLEPGDVVARVREQLVHLP